MFDLEKQIVEWRRQMLAAGIKSPVPLEELELHLREEIGRQIKLGFGGQQAFEIAIQKIGDTNMIKNEFKKVDAENWNRPLAWAAWILFAVSFFLPAFADLRGWQCAGLSAEAVSWKDFWRGDGGALYLASLALANLVMIASAFLLPRFSQSLRFIKYWRAFSFLALVLVWSYVFLLFTHSHRNDMKIGCYLWTASFLLLFLSTLKVCTRKKHVVTN